MEVMGATRISRGECRMLTHEQPGGRDAIDGQVQRIGVSRPFGSAEQLCLLRGELLVGQDALLVQLPELLELLDRVGRRCDGRR
jgi:hypothetical protein